jgi:hypothetical protein
MYDYARSATTFRNKELESWRVVCDTDLRGHGPLSKRRTTHHTLEIAGDRDGTQTMEISGTQSQTISHSRTSDETRDRRHAVRV